MFDIEGEYGDLDRLPGVTLVGGHDFSRWVAHCLHDAVLGRELHRLERHLVDDPEPARRAMLTAVAARYFD